MKYVKQYKLLAASTMYFIHPDLFICAISTWFVFVYFSQTNLFQKKRGIAKCSVYQVRCL